MSRESQDEITFDGVKHYLCRVGFDQPIKLNRTLAFQHSVSGTLIMLSIPPDGRTIRPADLLSMQMRLEKDGLVDDAALAQLKSGQLPDAA